MPRATVSIAFVNDPKPGKSFGSIKTNEMGYISVRPEELKLFRKGEKYEIEYDLKGEYKNFIRIIPIAQASSGTAAAPSDQSRLIFITGIVGRAMGSGKFAAEDVKNLTLEAQEAWKALAALTTPDQDCPF